jgi:hypothetical protein
MIRRKEVPCAIGIRFQIIYRAFANLYVVKQNLQLALCTQLATNFLIANYCTRWRCSFSGWEGAKFAENLCVSLFNKDLSNETTFGQIYLGGHKL